MAERLKGKVALISGGASGIGAACAAAFVAEGADVMLGDIDMERGRRLAADLGARFERLDVTRAADWRQAVATAESAFGRLDILVSNAGICSMAGLLDEDEATWDRTVAVNQTGAWHGMRAAVPAMERAGGGSVVLVSSIWGKVGVAGATAYQATKGALVLLAKATAAELAGRGIRVNALLPGIVDTPFLGVLTPEQRLAIAGLSLMKREGRPGEIAQAATYLASDESSYVTGAELVVDGGYTTC
jgi:cyclopentanol dehydrogenase